MNFAGANCQIDAVISCETAEIFRQASNLKKRTAPLLIASITRIPHTIRDATFSEAIVIATCRNFSGSPDGLQLIQVLLLRTIEKTCLANT